MNNNKIVEFYNNFLPYLMNQDNNARVNYVKTELGSIVKPDMSVLDLGCGIGTTSKFMAQLDAKVTAVDISPVLIEYARLNSSHKNISYVTGDISNLKIDKKFDIISIVDAYEHVPRGNIIGLLKTIDIHAHDNTIVYINIPDERFQKEAQKYIPEKLQIIDEAHSISAILDVFRAIEFEVSKINVYGIDAKYQYNSFIFMRKDKFLWQK